MYMHGSADIDESAGEDVPKGVDDVLGCCRVLFRS